MITVIWLCSVPLTLLSCILRFICNLFLPVNTLKAEIPEKMLTWISLTSFHQAVWQPQREKFMAEMPERMQKPVQFYLLKWSKSIVFPFFNLLMQSDFLFPFESITSESLSNYITLHRCAALQWAPSWKWGPPQTREACRDRRNSQR